jgi:hypothetical protein
MWFWRRRRRVPPPVVIPALDRLAELVERVVTLLDNGELPPEPAAPPGGTAARSDNGVPAAAADAAPHLLFVPSADGYVLLERNGSAPAAGATADVDGVAFVVLRLGPSPLPGDRRRCAFLEEEPVAARTSDE